MGKVLQFRKAEQWAHIVETNDLTIQVSSTGQLHISGEATLTLAEALHVFGLLKEAYVDDSE